MTGRARWACVALLSGAAGCSVYSPEIPCRQPSDCDADSTCAPSGFCVARPGPDTPEEIVPAAEIVEVEQLSALTLGVTVRLVAWGDPRATALGACAQVGDALRCESEPTGTRDSVVVELAALEAGSVVTVYPGAWVNNTQYLGTATDHALPPPAPADVTASDGTSANVVSVRWTAARGATEYSVYRDGIFVATTASTTFVDADAEAGGQPGAPLDVVASQGTRSDGIEVRWTPTVGEPGATHRYSVVSHGDGGSSPESAGDPGFRGPFAIVGFEVLRDGASMPARVDDATSYLDIDAPAGSWTLADVVASRGTDERGVVLSGNAQSEAGASTRYVVSAINQAGTSSATSSNAGWRAAPPSVVQWRGVRLNGPANQVDELGVPSDVSLDWELETASADVTVEDVEPGVFIYFLARIAWDESAGPWQLVDVGWRAECSDAEACGEGLECHMGLCSTAGFRSVQSHTNWVGWADNVDYRVVGYYRPFDARFPDAYELGATEVTQGEWADVFGTNPSFHSSCGPGCPVENVSWFAALQYANEMSTTAGLAPCYHLGDCSGAAADGTLSCETVEVLSESGQPIDCEGYRLPHELEFELGARGGSRPFGLTWISGARCDTPEPYYEAMSVMASNSWRDSAQCALAARDADGGCQAPWPVGSREPNNIELFDMHGNVSEWVWDREWNYRAAYAAPDFGEAPPVSPGLFGKVGVRGGRFSDCFAWVVPSVRRFEWPQNPRPYIGFRLARTL